MVISVFAYGTWYKHHNNPAMITGLQSTSVYPNACVWYEGNWGREGGGKKLDQTDKDN